MGLPRKLKRFNVYGDGESFLGQCVEVKLPVLKRLLEGYRGAGMTGEAKVDMGQDEIEIEHKYGGFMRPIFRQYAAPRHDAAMLRFVGAYQREDEEGTQAVEVVIRGRHAEVDPGTAKQGDDTEFAVKTTCTYYKLIVDGAVVVELDIVNGIEIVEGVDRTAEARAIVGG